MVQEVQKVKGVQTVQEVKMEDRLILELIALQPLSLPCGSCFLLQDLIE